ncbi:hypothetical protein AK812_SmicGene25576 [Symbiodinium microadriaticum]|uniref:Pyrrolo-quinoline quinone repeat domain-containing protein n=1 Tax=Symbiodinium microadriaticum TaxID=2951 RepID=A0A1Q9DBL9_SYMMI|nr:hypothetical protein AK812_SmicGene25576 [Symbiodinium microadriaticum]
MRLRLPCWLLLALLAAKLRPLALNRLLLEPSELVGRQARLALQDRRAVHVAKVLQLRDGDTLRVGILGGGADNNATMRWIWPAGSEGTWRSDSGKPRPPRLEIEDMLHALEEQELPDFLEIRLSAPAETLPLPAPLPKVDLLLVPPPFDRFQRLLPQLAQLGLGRVDLCKVPGPQYKHELLAWSGSNLRAPYHPSMLWLTASLAFALVVGESVDDAPKDTDAASCTEEGLCAANFLQMALQSRRRENETLPWPNFRGQIPGQYGTAAVGFGRLGSPAWSFHHPEGKYHSILSGGAAIDEDRNLYQKTIQGVFKLSKSGEVLWRYDPPGLDNNEVALLGPAVLGTTRNGKAWAVDRHTGKELWVTKLANDAGADCGYPAGYDGIFVAAAKAGTDPRMQGGNMQVFGLNATTGGILWEYDVDLPTWNFAPLFPGDGSFVFMDFAGGTYRRQSFSDGGATLGPNQMVYTCSNFGESLGAKGTNSTGIVRAFGLKAGDLVWQRRTDSPCNSWPAVGSLTGVYSLAVVVTPGAFVGQPDLDASILALNAETGEDIWNVVLTGYTGPAPFFQAAGDTEGILPRLIDGIQPLCLPAHFSAPNIDKNGVVYVGRCDGEWTSITSLVHYF